VSKLIELMKMEQSRGIIYIRP